MVQTGILTFNPFQENTYILWDDTRECVIIDPGCSNAYEEMTLSQFVAEKELTPVKLINTHCHIDHVLGNAYVAEKYKLELGIHEEDLKLLHAVAGRAMTWGVPYTPSPEPSCYIQPGDVITFGKTKLSARFVPGHAPGHLVFVCEAEKFVIAGDTLFKGSIGRTDLPFSDFATLERSVREELYTLPDDYVVYPGHGPSTTIGEEKQHNPYIRP